MSGLFQEGPKELFSILYSQSFKMSAISCFRNLHAIGPRVRNYSNQYLVKVESGFMGSTVKQTVKQYVEQYQASPCLSYGRMCKYDHCLRFISNIKMHFIVFLIG